MRKIFITVLALVNQVFWVYATGPGTGNTFAEACVTTPSPTAYELGKYGQVPVGLFTGAPDINLPLYVYKTKNLSVPISLSYSSNGIKVDQLESNVGLGWSLNAGGVISRIARDGAD